MRRIRALVFDLDGTLIDSLADIAAAANHALARAGYAEREVNEIRSFVGDGARSLIARAAGIDANSAPIENLLELFLDYYTAHATEHTRLMPCALETLSAFADLELGLCTNKPRRTTNAVLGGLNLEHCFQITVAGGDLIYQKPHPAPLMLIADRLGIPASELVMIGDGPQDIECGRAAGSRTIGVEGGLAARERLLASQPEALIASLCELPALIANWRGAHATSA